MMSLGGFCAGIEFSRRGVDWKPEPWPPSVDEREECTPEEGPLLAESVLGVVEDCAVSKRAPAKISADATTRRSEDV